MSLTMAEPINTCPIWGTRFEAEGTYDPETKTYEVEESKRAFVGFKIKKPLLDRFVNRMSDGKKAQLTSWLIDQWWRGDDQPEITFQVLIDLIGKRPLPVHVRADRLLRFISLSTRSRQLGEFVRFPWHWHAGFAWSESTDRSDIKYLLDYLEKKGWLERDPFGLEFGQDVPWRVFS